MAVLAAILPLVSQCSALSLVLYRLGAAPAETHAAKQLQTTAKALSSLGLIVKEIGTIVKEDDRLPSPEAFETIQDGLDQSNAILTEITAIASANNADQIRRHSGEQQYDHGRRSPVLTPQSMARLHYLEAHLDALRATFSVMVQALYTAQSIIWARVRPTVSPRQCAIAVANEKQQLETLIIDQQMSILVAFKLYERARPDAQLLMENDSTLSLSIIDETAPKPSTLAKYQVKLVANLDTQSSREAHWLASVCAASKSQVDRLVDQWSRLRQIEQDLLDAERRAQAQKRETQQPFVESDSEDDLPPPQFPNSGVRMETPVPRKTEATPANPFASQDSAAAPSSPRSSTGSLPVEAAAAVEAKDRDDDIDLEIPWILRTRKYFWKYIDGKVYDSNTDLPSSEAFSHRYSWTEVQASWVCKEALKEAGYSYTQVQKDVLDGRRTKLETWFCIDHPLTFVQMQRLVERTVDIYRETQPHSRPASPPASPRRTSLEQRPVSSGTDRDRTPQAPQNQSHPPPPPPLDRSATAYRVSQPPPSLDRSMSMPGPERGQQPQPQPPPPPPPQAQPSLYYPPNPRPPNLQTSTSNLPPPPLYSPRLAPQQQPPLPPPPPQQQQQPPTTYPQPQPQPHPYQNQPPYPNPNPNPYQQNIPLYPPPPPPRPHPTFNPSYPPPPPARLAPDLYSSTSGPSDAESTSRSSRKYRDRDRDRSRDRSRSRERRSRRRRERERERERERDKYASGEGGGYGGLHGHGKTKALMGVAGLTALLDGLVGI